MGKKTAVGHLDRESLYRDPRAWPNNTGPAERKELKRAAMIEAQCWIRLKKERAEYRNSKWR